MSRDLISRKTFRGWGANYAHITQRRHFGERELPLIFAPLAPETVRRNDNVDDDDDRDQAAENSDVRVTSTHRVQRNQLKSSVPQFWGQTSTDYIIEVYSAHTSIVVVIEASMVRRRRRSGVIGYCVAHNLLLLGVCRVSCAV